MRIFLWCISGFAATAFVLSSAVGQAGREDSKSARHFVEEFYAWYAPQTLIDHEGFTAEIALKERKASFGDELFQRLKADLDAQAHCGEIIGIDFDPFLSGQDPAERYEVKEVWNKGSHYWANVYSVGNGIVATKPDVRPEFSRINGRWVFEDFQYPEEHTSLLKVLRLPRPKCTEPTKVEK